MKKLIASLVVLALAAPAAVAAASHFVTVSPGTVKQGKTVRVHGVVNGCAKSDKVILISKAFKGSTTKEFAGLPALYVSQNAHHDFSVTVTIDKAKVKKGTYTIGGRCGGGNFGGTTLKVS